MRRGLGNIVARLTAARRSMEAANVNEGSQLAAFNGFGSNPGALDARIYVPSNAPRALVVVLHGCTQNAAVYDRGSGWSKLAAQHDFAVLFPQQRRSNNANLCFNWYLPSDARRGRGEAASISQMVQHAAAKFGLDRSNVFITGLSAGGAMTSVMLACYPELFAGGAIIAGLPFASANTLPQALERMRGHGFQSRHELYKRAKQAADKSVVPPTLSVWHGTNDTIVDPANAAAIVDQWRDLHGLGDAAGRTAVVSGHIRTSWSDERNRPLIERYDVRGMGHGVPIDARHREACGTAGPHMLQAGICSTRHIAESWSLANEAPASRELKHEPSEVSRVADRPKTHVPFPARPSGVGAVIEDALRAAGLMR